MSRSPFRLPVSRRSRTSAAALRLLPLGPAAALLLLIVPGERAHAQSQTEVAHVTLNAALPSLASVSSYAYGVNTAAWDPLMTDSALPALVSGAALRTLRYPGGSWSDQYHWQTNSGTPGSGVNPNSNDGFDNFMTLAKAASATPIITVNYGSNAAGNGGGDPSEAAAWVNYAKSNNYGVKFWEIGNEVYGNGEYGNGWEEDLHSDHSPAAYGTNALSFITAMKAQDSTIKVGVVLACPGSYPSGESPDWNSNVLEQCGSKIDFVIIHWYPQNPGGESDSGLLAQPAQIASIMSSVKAQIKQYCGSNAPNVKVFVTETNSVSTNPGKQVVGLVNGLFLADEMPTWLEHGASNVDIWDLHNGLNTGGNNSSGLYGAADYGDYGILSLGLSDSSSNAYEPPAETPFASYYGAQMDSYVAKSGDKLIPAVSDQPLVSVHSGLRANGQLTALLINKSASETYTTAVNVNGFVARSATEYVYNESSTRGIGKSGFSITGNKVSVSLPPYSMTTLVMDPSSGATPAAFKTTATVAAPSVSPGNTEKIGVAFEALNKPIGDVTPVVQIYDPNWTMVAQQAYPGTSIAANQSFNGSAAFASTGASTPGQYHIEDLVEDASGNAVYTDNPALTFSINASDSSEYGFESSAQGWSSTSPTVTGVASSNAEAYLGADSLQIALNETGADSSPIIGTTPPSSLTAGKTVSFHVWVPAGAAISAVQPYVQQGSTANYLWTGNYVSYSSLNPNAWNTITVTVPSNAVMPMFGIGVQFVLSGNWTGGVYVDSVSW